MKKQFDVTFVCKVRVGIDESLTPDDEWRSHFYSYIKSLKDVAEHIAYNAVMNGIDKLSRLDGFADRDDSLSSIDTVYELEDCIELQPDKKKLKR